MNIIGEYSIQYNLYTMFDVYQIKIKNHNLITKKGYEFFLKKWYTEEIYPIQLGYYHNNKFYEIKNIDDTYDYELNDYGEGSYSTTTNYIDKDTYRQYRFDGENFVEFNEKLEKICVGDYNYFDEESTKASDTDSELYSPVNEFEVDNGGFVLSNTQLKLQCTLNNEDIDGTTEIGVKTNHGRLVSHDIHAPYNLPYGDNIILEYVFKLAKEE